MLMDRLLCCATESISVTEDPPEDVNERVVEEWIDDTTPFERVYVVVRRTYDPQSADELAERARVSPTTARKHLRTLADVGEIATEERGRTTLYRRSETAIVTEHAQRLLDERTTEEIASGVAEMKERIRSWREEYGVESPEEFARRVDTADIDTEQGRLLTEWQTTRRNLELAQAALAIGEATRGRHRSRADDDGDGNDPSAIV